MLTTYLPKVIKIPQASWYRAKKAPWDLEKKHTKEVIKVHGEVVKVLTQKKGEEKKKKKFVASITPLLYTKYSCSARRSTGSSARVYPERQKSS